MAHSILRTASMAISKKNPSKRSRFPVNCGVSSNSGSGGRRHTMLPVRPPVRDSVLSNGSSDRSSSVSDETILSPPLPVSYGNDFFRYVLVPTIHAMETSDRGHY